MDIVEWGNKWLKEKRDKQYRHNYCKLTEEAIAWLNGELLGDGYMSSQFSVSARFRYSSKYLEYIEYVVKMLGSFGIEQSGRTHERITKWGHGYACQSRRYVDLYPLKKSWYPEPACKKVVPRNITLTPITCRQWYIGDGCLHHGHKGRPSITLYTNAFSTQDVKWLIKQLWKIGVLATKRSSNNTIGISTHSTKDFLSYIGECPVECYKYKWSYEKKQRI